MEKRISLRGRGIETLYCCCMSTGRERASEHVFLRKGGVGGRKGGCGRQEREGEADTEREGPVRGKQVYAGSSKVGLSYSFYTREVMRVGHPDLAKYSAVASPWRMCCPPDTYMCFPSDTLHLRQDAFGVVTHTCQHVDSNVDGRNIVFTNLGLRLVTITKEVVTIGHLSLARGSVMA